MEELHVPQSDNPGKYLGLPSFSSRSKKVDLGYLKTRNHDKLQGWRTNTLNQTGKEILIKEVITIIPTYAISAFSIPKTWCAEIKL